MDNHPSIHLLLLAVTLCSLASPAVFQAPLIRRSHPIKSDTIAKVGNSTLLNWFDQYYVINATIGTPPQSFVLLLDTASSNLFVIDAACDTSDCTGVFNQTYIKQRFYKSNSTSYKASDDSFSAHYYDVGTAAGSVGTDVVTFAGLKLIQQSFGLVNSPPAGFANIPVDGYLGLAWHKLANGVQDPLNKIVAQLDSPLFTVWLDRKINADEQPSGLLTLGAVDNANCIAPFNYVPLTTESYWQFAVDDFSVGGYDFPFKQQAISDTGSWWLGLPPAQLDAIVAATGAEFQLFQGIYTVDCSATLPDINLKIGGHNYAITQADYTIPMGQGQCWLLINFFDMSSSDPSAPILDLGQPFIRATCNLYDVGQKRIGFAKAQHTN